MDENQPSSSWDDLIRKIGAAPAPDALERRRPAIETQFEPPAAAAPPPKAPPGDWNALADKLGIEVPPEPERSRGKPERETAAETPGPSSEALEASLARIEPMESDFEEVVEQEIADIDFEDDDFELEQQPQPEDEQPLSGEAARTAFDSLFQAGSFAAMPPVEKSPRSLDDGRGEQRWRDLDETRDAVFDEGESAESVRRPDATGEAESPRAEEQGRPRRRRRRGRGREERGGRAEEIGAPGEPEGVTDDWAEPVGDREEAEGEPSAEGEKPRRRRVRRRRGRGRVGEAAEDRPAPAARNGRSEPSKDSDEEDQDDDAMVASMADEEDGDEDADAADRASHKNIPTWSEAIGVMVETNMQSRKNAPQRPSSSRDRGRGRGRGRGGRRGKS